MEKRKFVKWFWFMFLVAILTSGWHTLVSAAEQAVIDGAKKEGKFVWYTSMPTEPAVAYLKAFKEKYPFLDVSEFFRSTSMNVWSRFETEYKAGKAIADVMHIAALPPYIKMVDDGWLMKFDSPVYKEYPKEYVNPGYYAAFRSFAMIGGYNKEVLSPNQVPKTWKELADPKWKGKLGVEPGSSGAQAVIYHTLKEVLGGQYWEQIGRNKPKVYTGTGATTVALQRGEIDLAMCYYGYAVYEERELKKSPIMGIWFEEGTPRVDAPMGILKNAPHPNSAKLFLEWALSKEGQIKMVEIVGSYSARPDVPPAKNNPPPTKFKSLVVKDIKAFTGFLNQFPDIWKGVIE